MKEMLFGKTKTKDKKLEHRVSSNITNFTNSFYNQQQQDRNV